MASLFFAVETGHIMKTNMILKGVFTVKKFLLVILIGMAVAINVYGIVKDFMVDEVEEVNHIEETTIAVYVE